MSHTFSLLPGSTTKSYRQEIPSRVASFIMIVDIRFEMVCEPQRDLTPEQAASRLRAVKETHYTKK